MKFTTNKRAASPKAKAKGTAAPLPLTPYAELLVSPSAGDKEIRQVFQALARTEHPDRDGADGEPGPRWFAVAGAYARIKTEASRATWAAEMQLRSGVCEACGGFGVAGSRLTRVRACGACGGVGRVR